MATYTTEYAEDDQHTTGDKGPQVLTVRQNTAASLSGTDGDYQPLITDTNGRLHVLDPNTGTIATGTSSIDGKITACDTGAVVVSSGTVTANLSATDNAVLDSIDADTTTIIGHVDGIEGILTTIDTDTGNIATDSSTIAGDTTSIDGKITACDTGNVTIGAELPAGTNDIGVVGHNHTGIGHGVKTVTTAGTDEALAGSTACKRVTIQAQTDNTGYIAVGASGVDATVATGTGVLLTAGAYFELDIDNLADVFIDSTVNGEGVRYTYFT